MQEQQNAFEKKLEELLTQFDEYGFVPSKTMENDEKFAVRYKQELTTYVRGVIRVNKRWEENITVRDEYIKKEAWENSMICRECIKLLEAGNVDDCIDKLEDLYVKEQNKTGLWRLPLKRVKE